MPFDPEEKWRPIPGYEGLYEVSDLGRVRSVRVLAARPDRARREFVALRPKWNGKQQVALDLVVAAAFLPPPPEPTWHLAHKDGDRANSLPENLEWRPYRDIRPRAKLTEAQVRAIRAQRGTVPNKVLAARYNMSREGINSIQTGRTWKHLSEPSENKKGPPPSSLDESSGPHKAAVCG